MQHHVAVAMSPGERPAPGLLLEWERREDGWWGHVWLLRGVSPHAPYTFVVDAWVPASRLSPA